MPGTGRNHPIETPVRRTPLKIEKATAQSHGRHGRMAEPTPRPRSTRSCSWTPSTKIRDGQVANRPIYVVMAVTVDGTRDILGVWAGAGSEGAKFGLKRRCA